MTATEKRNAAQKTRASLPRLFGIASLPRGVETAKELWRLADQLTKELVGQHETFRGLLEAWELHRYRPTMRADLDPRFDVLADLYDFFQAANGRDVVAYRG